MSLQGSDGLVLPIELFCSCRERLRTTRHGQASMQSEPVKTSAMRLAEYEISIVDSFPTSREGRVSDAKPALICTAEEPDGVARDCASDFPPYTRHRESWIGSYAEKLRSRSSLHNTLLRRCCDPAR